MTTITEDGSSIANLTLNHGGGIKTNGTAFVSNSQASYDGSRHNTPLASGDHYCSFIANVLASNNYFDAKIRHNTGSGATRNGWHMSVGADIDGTSTWAIAEITNGVSTNRATGSVAFSPGSRIRGEASGTTLTLKVGNTTVGSYTSSLYQSQTYVGLGIYRGPFVGTMDDFEAADLAASGPTTVSRTASSAGVAAVSGASKSIHRKAGSVAASSALTAVAKAVYRRAAASAAAATVSAVGQALTRHTAAATATAAASMSAVGQALTRHTAAATAAAAAAVSAIGQAVTGRAATLAGAAAASAIGRAITLRSASADGASTTSAIGQAIALRSASAAGASTAVFTSGGAIVAATVAIAASGAFAPSGQALASSTSPVTGTSEFAPAAKVISSRAAISAGAATFDPTSQVVVTRAATSAAASGLAAESKFTASRAASLAGTSTFSAAELGDTTIMRAFASAGASTVVGQARAITSRAAISAGASTLAPIASLVIPSLANTTAAAATAPTGKAVFNGNLAISSAATLSGVAQHLFTTTVRMDGIGAFAPSRRWTHSVIGSLSGATTLAFTAVSGEVVIPWQTEIVRRRNTTYTVRRRNTSPSPGDAMLEKTSFDIRIYAIDCSENLGEGIFITGTPTISVKPTTVPPLVVTVEEVDGTSVKVRISGGAAESELVPRVYSCQVRHLTNEDGIQIAQPFSVEVQEGP